MFLRRDLAQRRLRDARLRAIHLLQHYDESEHPRDEHGRWTDSGGGSDSSSSSETGPSTKLDTPAGSAMRSQSGIVTVRRGATDVHQDVELLVNPTHGQLEDLIVHGGIAPGSEDFGARVMQDRVGNLFAWSAYDAIHDDMMEALTHVETMWAADLFVIQDGKLVSETAPGTDKANEWIDKGQANAKLAAVIKPVSSGPTETFVSPNTGTLNFAQAKGRLNSQHEQALRKASADVDQALGIETSSAHVALGAWRDGAENSLIVRSNATPAQARVSAAMKGWLANQKSVLLFQPKVGGGQFKATFTAKTYLDKAHDDLLKAGLEFHTLEPATEGILVHVYGDSQQTLDAVGKIVGQYGTTANVTFGEGEFIGTKLETGSDQEQREDARREYEAVIAEAAGQLPGRDVARIWDDVRGRWGGPLSEAEVNWSLTGGGPKGETWQSVAESALADWKKNNPKIHAETVALNDDFDRMMKAAAEHEDFRDWYDAHRPLATVLFDGQEGYVEKFLAASSINRAGKHNADEGLRAAIHFVNGGTFEKKNYSGIDHTTRAEYLKIQHGEPLTGLKVVPFHQALMGNWNRVPVDRHMKDLLFQNPQNTGHTRGQSEVAEAVITAMADKLGWRPAELQAVLWAVDKADKKTNNAGIIFTYQQYLQKEQSRVASLLAAHKKLKTIASYRKSLSEDEVGIVMEQEIAAYEGARLLLGVFAQIHDKVGTHPTPKDVAEALQLNDRAKQAMRRAFKLLGRDYDEDKHPRDEHGRWTSGGGGSDTSGDGYVLQDGPLPSQSVLAVANRIPDFPSGHSVEVLVNPTLHDVVSLVRDGDAVRVARDEHHNIYVWNALAAIHIQIVDSPTFEAISFNPGPDWYDNHMGESYSVVGGRVEEDDNKFDPEHFRDGIRIGQANARLYAEKHKVYNEEDHPRDEDGRWTDAGGGDGGSGETAFGGLVTPPDLKLEPQAIDVGGDAWNKQTAVRLESEYQRAKPLLESIVQGSSGEEIDTIVEDDNDDHDDDAPMVPEEWDMLSGDQQEDAKTKYIDSNKESAVDSEVNNWHENGDALDDAKAQVAEGFMNLDGTEAWITDAIDDWRISREENGKPVPYTTIQILDSIGLDYPTGHEGKGDLDITFNDEKLMHPSNLVPEQGLLPGIEPIVASSALSVEMRDEIEKVINKAFDKEADKVEGDLDAPDYLAESAMEWLEEDWDHNLSDKDKWNWIKNNTDIIEDAQKESDEYYENHTSGGVYDVELPGTYDPLESNGDKTDYERTQRLAAYLSLERQVQLLKDRDIIGDAVFESNKSEIRRVDRELWGAWKGSSQSFGGQLLQLATSEELGGRYRDLASTPSQLKSRADKDYGEIGGYDGVKALVRAKWETSQYLLDKADIHVVEVYRGLKMDLPKDEKIEEVAAEHWQDPGHKEVSGNKVYQRIPDASIVRNGAFSTTTDRNIANNWNGGSGNTKIVLRIEAPRTSVLSLPAYGVNVHSEHEVVVAGTAWKHWDAWKNNAPGVSDVPIVTPHRKLAA